MCPGQERPFKPMAKGKLQFTSIFRDARLQVEKPAAIMDDIGNPYSFYYSLVGVRPVEEY